MESGAGRGMSRGKILVESGAAVGRGALSVACTLEEFVVKDRGRRVLK